MIMKLLEEVKDKRKSKKQAKRNIVENIDLEKPINNNILKSESKKSKKRKVDNDCVSTEEPLQKKKKRKDVDKVVEEKLSEEDSPEIIELCSEESIVVQSKKKSKSKKKVVEENPPQEHFSEDINNSVPEKSIGDKIVRSKKKKKNIEKKGKETCSEEHIIQEINEPPLEESMTEKVVVSKKKKKKDNTKNSSDVSTPSVNEFIENPSPKKSDSSQNYKGFGLIPVEDRVDLSGENNLYSKWADKGKFCDYVSYRPCSDVGRPYTVSIALPASILEDTCLLTELRTAVVGQIARAAAVYSVDEIIIFDDGCWSWNGSVSPEDLTGMMKVLLEYQECPPYIRKSFFPFHPYTRKVGILNALNAPHHLQSDEWCMYRDGVVTEELVNNKFSLVNVGLRTYVEVDSKIPPGVRVTVKFPPEAQYMKKPYGTVVSPKEPREKAGLYWGYSVRVANSLSEVFVRDDEPKHYDLIIGTSEKGSDAQSVQLPKFQHALIVFGGVKGLEAAMKNDQKLSKTNPEKLFQHYINVCPDQQSRTIRTEEAIWITLCSLSRKLKC